MKSRSGKFYVMRHMCISTGDGGCGAAALGAVGVPAAIKEWQDSPRKTVHLSCGAVLREGADSVLYSRVRALVIKAKNLRSGLSTIDVNTDIGKDSQFYVGGAVTAHIDVVIEAENNVTTKHCSIWTNRGKHSRLRLRRGSPGCWTGLWWGRKRMPSPEAGQRRWSGSLSRHHITSGGLA